MIDREKVLYMKRTCFTNVEIAKRLSCSERQVRRIINEFKKNGKVFPKAVSGGNSIQIQNQVLDFYLSFETEPKVAKRIGVTKQAVNKMRKAI